MSIFLGNERDANVDELSVGSDTILTEQRQDYMNKLDEVGAKILLRASKITDIDQHIKGQLEEISSVKATNFPSSTSVVTNKTAEMRLGQMVLNVVDRMVQGRDAEFKDVICFNFDINKFLHESESRNSSLVMERAELQLELNLTIKQKRTEAEMNRRYRQKYREAIERAISDFDQKVQSGEIAKETADEVLQNLEVNVEKSVQRECDLFEENYSNQIDFLVDKRNEAQRRFAEIDAILKGSEKVEKLLRGYSHWASKIMQQIKNIVEPYDNLKSYLNENVRLKNVGIKVNAPFQHDNLSGVLYLLQQKFGDLQFPAVAQKVLELVNYSANSTVTENNPIQAAQRVQEYMAEWEQFRLFDKLTPDLLFSLVLYRSFTPGVLQDELYKAILMQNYKKDDLTDSTPMFTHLTKLIRAKQEAIDNQITRTSFKTNDTYRKKSYVTPNSIPKKPVEFEHAHVADGTKPDDNPKPLFKGEVFKEQGIIIQEQTARGLVPRNYIAVHKLSSICSLCFNEKNQICESTKHQPKVCFQTKCVRCGFYGHKQTTCHQSHNTQGSLLSQN